MAYPISVLGGQLKMYMKRLKHLKTWPIVIFSLFYFTSCSGTDFNASGGQKSKSTSTMNQKANQPSDKDNTSDVNSKNIGDDGLSELYSEEFLMDRENRPIDLILFVDQSQSMPGEMKIVKDNLPKFRETLSSYGDLRMALINAPDGAGRKLTDLLVPAFLSLFDGQIDMVAKSKNGIEVFTQFIKQKEYKTDSGKIAGSIFFRENANKYYVIVSDEDESVPQIEDKNMQTPEGRASWFVNYLDSNAGLKDLKVFAFAGLKEDSGCGVKEAGATYLELANKMMTKVYDICQKDWTNSLNDLASQIQAFAYKKIRLKKSPKEIVQVTIDGEKVGLSDVVLKEDTVEINLPIAEIMGKKVVIEYR